MKKRLILTAAAMFLALPAIAAAQGGLIGDCVDCHTMHNSEQGAAVAELGTAGTITNTPIQNLLRMDCIACHVDDPYGGVNIVDMGGGSAIPQVAHQAPNDLASGNFTYIATGSSRRGHNVSDLASLFGGTGDNNGGPYGAPPGKYRKSTHGPVFSTDPGAVATSFDLFTCAGAAGCHGTRSQLLSGTTNDNGTVGDTSDDTFTGVTRTGIAAISGAHHANYDGAKTGANYATAQVHDGQVVADGYRFITGLWGYGNETNRWRNVNATSHNEYYGAVAPPITPCGGCHIEGTQTVVGGFSSRMTTDSLLITPNNSMSGFCATCHGAFHSAGDGNGGLTNDGWGPNNGTSGAFLRHPSDYVIPTTGEYAGYTTYAGTGLTALVAVDDISSVDGTDATVVPGSDMVMCLSCHKAHASQFDAMLRFDYSLQQAGNAGATGLAQGCLACHTTKGVLPTGP